MKTQQPPYKNLIFTLNTLNPSEDELLRAFRRLKKLLGEQPAFFSVSVRARNVPKDRYGHEAQYIHAGTDGGLYTGYSLVHRKETWMDNGIVLEDGTLRVVDGNAQPEIRKSLGINEKLDSAGLPRTPRASFGIPKSPMTKSMRASGWGAVRGNRGSK